MSSEGIIALRKIRPISEIENRLKSSLRNTGFAEKGWYLNKIGFLILRGTRNGGRIGIGFPWSYMCYVGEGVLTEQNLGSIGEVVSE